MSGATRLGNLFDERQTKQRQSVSEYGVFYYDIIIDKLIVQ